METIYSLGSYLARASLIYVVLNFSRNIALLFEEIAAVRQGTVVLQQRGQKGSDTYSCCKKLHKRIEKPFGAQVGPSQILNTLFCLLGH